MRKIFILLLLPVLLLSCFDEKAAGNFLDGTEWSCMNTGVVYEGEKLQYGYQEIHTLTFGGNTFIQVSDGKYDRDNDGRYEEEDTQTKKGTYKFEYPQTKLVFEDGTEIMITITTNQLTTESDQTGKYYIFIPKK